MPIFKNYKEYLDKTNKTDLKNWGFDNDKIYRVFKFEDFDSAILFINSIATLSNKIDHHPDISLFDYKFVKISFKSHDENAVTTNDYKSAHLVDKIYAGEDLW
jgi:4a-hydroxytetrahydrobiopterin dehydratase